MTLSCRMQHCVVQCGLNLSQWSHSSPGLQPPLHSHRYTLHSDTAIHTSAHLVHSLWRGAGRVLTLCTPSGEVQVECSPGALPLERCRSSAHLVHSLWRGAGRVLTWSTPSGEVQVECSPGPLPLERCRSSAHLVHSLWRGAGRVLTWSTPSGEVQVMNSYSWVPEGVIKHTIVHSGHIVWCSMLECTGRTAGPELRQSQKKYI